MTKLYKYLSPDLFSLIFKPEGFVEIKSSYPRDFNDPYELFLAINTNGIGTELLAYYQETVGTIPQYPTLCFSKQPDVVPMWAHYARESSGFVLEIDEDLLTKLYPNIAIADIDYSKVSTVIDVDYVARAYGTGKPRHTYWLQQAAFHAAYFTKSAYWSYELERRLIVNEQYLSRNNSLMVMRIPISCVTSIIVGMKAEKELKAAVKKFSKTYKGNIFDIRLSRGSMKPFFKRGRSSYEFNGEEIAKSKHFCRNCKEPLYSDDTLACHWCAITEAQKYNAARKNPLRMLANYGLLEGYMDSMDDIANRHKT